MSMKDLVHRNRSYRRFDQSIPIAAQTLRDLIDLARVCPSGMNAQPLRYMFSCDRAINDRIFSTLAWAGSLKDWDGPEIGEQPSGYIVVLVDGTAATAGHDVGIACQTMLLAAAERGLGGCMLGSVRRSELALILGVPEGYTISLVVALGTPVERIVLEEIDDGGSTTYYREPDGTHHVPKRKVGDIILGAFE